MHKQRAGILIVAILAVLTSFLPWYESPEGGSVSLIDMNGWQLFVLFGISIALCLTGNSLKPLSKKKFYGAIVPSILAGLMGVFGIWQFVDSVSGLHGQIKYGLYLMIILSIALPIVATKTKERRPNEEK